MRITLINTAKNLNYPTLYLPYGLLCLTQSLLERNYNVKIIDLFDLWNEVSFNLKKAKELINVEDSDIYGFYVRKTNLKIVSELSNHIKNYNKNSAIIVGGPEVTVNYNEFIDNKKYDYIVIGEGEEVIVTILENMEKNRNAFGRVITTEKTGFESNIVKNPPSFSKLLPLEILPWEKYKKYLKSDEIAVHVENGRGCRNNCTFCNSRRLTGFGRRYKSTKLLVEEIKRIYELSDQRVTKFQLTQDAINNDRDYFDELLNAFKEIKNEIKKFHWGGYAHINSITDTDIKRLNQTGCDNLFFGIESANKKRQINNGKIINIRDCEKKLVKLSNTDIMSTCAFIIGYPNETIDEIEETVDYVLNLHITYDVNILFTNYILQPFSSDFIKKSELSETVDINGFSTSYLELRNILQIIISCYPITFCIIKSFLKKSNLELLLEITYELQKRNIRLTKQVFPPLTMRDIIGLSIFKKYYQLSQLITEIEEYETIMSIIFKNDLSYSEQVFIKPFRIIFTLGTPLDQLLDYKKLSLKNGSLSNRKYYYLECLANDLNLYEISLDKYREFSKSKQFLRSQQWLKKAV